MLLDVFENKNHVQSKINFLLTKYKWTTQICVFTSTFPLLAHKKQIALGVTGKEVSKLRPPASHTFSTSWSLLKSTLIWCTPSQGALDFAGPLVEGVLSQFKLLLLGGLVVSGFFYVTGRRGWVKIGLTYLIFVFHLLTDVYNIIYMYTMYTN